MLICKIPLEFYYQCTEHARAQQNFRFSSNLAIISLCFQVQYLRIRGHKHKVISVTCTSCVLCVYARARVCVRALDPLVATNNPDSGMRIVMLSRFEYLKSAGCWSSSLMRYSERSVPMTRRRGRMHLCYTSRTKNRNTNNSRR